MAVDVGTPTRQLEDPLAVSAGRVLARTAGAEWTRLWSVRATWWFVGAATVVMVGLGTLLGFEAAADPAHLQGEPAWLTAQFIVMPAQFAFLALAVNAVTADYATGGIVPPLQCPPGRTTLWLARSLVTVVTATLLGTLLAATAAVAAATTSGSALTLTRGEADRMATVALVLAAGAVLAVGLGWVMRSAAGALISVFLLVLVLPLLLPAFGEWMTTVADTLPGAGVTYLLLGEPRDRMTTTAAVTVLLGWAVGAFLLGWLRMLRDDASR